MGAQAREPREVFPSCVGLIGLTFYKKPSIILTMNKTPYFYNNLDGTFTFAGYFNDYFEANAATGGKEIVDASFLYRTVSAANEALNNMPLPEGCTK